MQIAETDIEACFEKYADAFDRGLPYPVFETLDKFFTLGEFACYFWKNGTMKGQVIRVSDQVDWEEMEFESVVVHEMIHYYIAYYKIRDNEEHGREFMRLAKQLNERYGLKIAPRVDTGNFEKIGNKN